MQRWPAASIVVLALAAADGARAQEPQPEPTPEPKKLSVEIDYAFGWVQDNAIYESLGREQQMKSAYALVKLSARPDPHVTLFLELNAILDSGTPKPFAGDAPFYFPNAPDPKYGVVSDPKGYYDVDFYKNSGLDVPNPAPLRQGYLDLHTAEGRFGLVIGQFFVPLGLGLEEVTRFTGKDLPHAQYITSYVDAGAMLRARFGGDGFPATEISVAGVAGNGNPYADYAYFDFTKRGDLEDTNSGIGGIASLRITPVKGLELGGSVKKNFVSSRIESDILTHPKHIDDAWIAFAKYRPIPRLMLFGQLNRFTWGLRDTSAELFPPPTPESPIDKDGYFVGLEGTLPVKDWGDAGVVFIHEELDRDDFNVAYLASRGLYGVKLGAKERSNILKLFFRTRYVTAFAFWNDLDNPFPQASAIVAVAGPVAYEGAGSRKLGLGVRVRVGF